MPQNHIVCSTSAFPGLLAAVAWVTARLNASEVLVIGATKAAADEFARQLSPVGSLGLHCLSLIQVATEISLLRMAELGLAPLSRLGEEAVAARVTHRLNQANKLVYFAPVSTMAGFAAALASTVSELRLARIRPADVSGDSDAMQDLRQLLDGYEEELGERSLADTSRIFDLAREIGASGNHRLIGLPTVLLDLSLSSAAHVAFLTALAARSDGVFATTNSNDAAGIAALESALGAVAQPIQAEVDGSAIAQVRLDSSEELGYAASMERNENPEQEYHPERPHQRSLDHDVSHGLMPHNSSCTWNRPVMRLRRTLR